MLEAGILQLFPGDKNNNNSKENSNTNDECIYYSLLQKILDPNSGVNDSVNTLFNYVANNPVGNDIALDFLINQWNQIQSA